MLVHCVQLMLTDWKCINDEINIIIQLNTKGGYSCQQILYYCKVLPRRKYDEIVYIFHENIWEQS